MKIMKPVESRIRERFTCGSCKTDLSYNDKTVHYFYVFSTFAKELFGYVKTFLGVILVKLCEPMLPRPHNADCGHAAEAYLFSSRNISTDAEYTVSSLGILRKCITSL